MKTPQRLYWEAKGLLMNPVENFQKNSDNNWSRARLETRPDKRPERLAHGGSEMAAIFGALEIKYPWGHNETLPGPFGAAPACLGAAMSPAHGMTLKFPAMIPFGLQATRPPGPILEAGPSPIANVKAAPPRGRIG